MEHNKKVYFLVAAVLVAAFSTALFFQVLNASRMRLSGDDYCYNAVLSSHGFWGMQTESYMNVSTYHGNRYSLNFFSGLAGLFPVWGSALLSISGLLAWVLALITGLKMANRHWSLGLARIDIILLSTAYACLVLWGAPQLDQSFLWRSGMIPYFLPLVGGTWFVVLMLRLVHKGRYTWFDLALLFLSALMIGGFSETAAALFGGFWGLVFLGIAAWKIFRRGSIRHLFLPVVVTLLGVLLAILLLYFSPSTALRRGASPAALPFGELISELGGNLYTYFWLLAFRRTVYLIAPVLFGLGSGLSFFLSAERIDPKSFSKKSVLTAIGVQVILLAAALLLVACVMLPATYVFAEYPAGRTFILSQAVVTGLCILSGVLWAFLAASLLNYLRKDHPARRAARVVGNLLLLGTVFSPLMFIHSSFQDYRLYAKWARFWDERHVLLVEKAGGNEKDIHVVQLDKIIDSVGELGPDPDFWYNNCAEMYYGTNAIYADLPGWD